MSARTIAFSLLLSCGISCAGVALAAGNAKKPASPATPAPATTSATAPAADAKAATTPVTAATAEAAAGIGTQPAKAVSADSEELVRQDWPFQGAFGTYDRAALQRGFQVYKQVCSACHSMNLLSYRNLQDIGYTEGQVKAIAAEYQVSDINDDNGEVVQRPAKPSDRFKAPFANKEAAMYANNSAYPPDMSLLVKAREGGPDYIYSILTGFADFPAGVKHSSTQYWNKAMKGHIIAMPPPLVTDGQVQYENAGGVPQTKEQYARDVAQFLTWAAEPKMEERKQTGTKVFLFLLAFCFIAYNVKKKVWRDVH